MKQPTTVTSASSTNGTNTTNATANSTTVNTTQPPTVTPLTTTNTLVNPTTNKTNASSGVEVKPLVPTNCKSNEFLEGSVCKACHHSCASCSGPNANNCSSCLFS